MAKKRNCYRSGRPFEVDPNVGLMKWRFEAVHVKGEEEKILWTTEGAESDESGFVQCDLKTGIQGFKQIIPKLRNGIEIGDVKKIIDDAGLGAYYEGKRGRGPAVLRTGPEEPTPKKKKVKKEDSGSDDLDEMDRLELRKILKAEEIDFPVYKGKTTDDEIREAIKAARGVEEPEEEPEEEELEGEDELEGDDLEVGEDDITDDDLDNLEDDDEDDLEEEAATKGSEDKEDSSDEDDELDGLEDDDELEKSSEDEDELEGLEEDELEGLEEEEEEEEEKKPTPEERFAELDRASLRVEIRKLDGKFKFIKESSNPKWSDDYLRRVLAALTDKTEVPAP